MAPVEQYEWDLTSLLQACQLVFYKHLIHYEKKKQKTIQVLSHDYYL
jgi:hypothetical protein